MTKPASAPSQPRKRRRGAWRKWVVGLLVATALVVAVIVALQPKPVAVSVAPVMRETFVERVREDGVTRVRDRYVVSMPLSGHVGRLQLRAGDNVEHGEKIAGIQPALPPLADAHTRSELQARVNASVAAKKRAQTGLEQARLELDYAKREYERSKELAASGAEAQAALDSYSAKLRTSRQNVEAAQFGLQFARHEVEMARAALLRSKGNAAEEGAVFEITAPVDGRVLRVFQRSEGVLPAGTALFELGDPAALQIVVDVLTTDAVRIRPGAPVTITRWGKEHELKGRVRRVEPQAFTKVSALGVEEQRVNVIVDLTSSREQWQALGDGYRVEAAIEVERVEDAILVPETALFRDGDKWAVFVLEDEVAKMRHVEITQRNGQQAVMGEPPSVTPGMRVVVHPSDALTSGARVTVE